MIYHIGKSAFSFSAFITSFSPIVKKDRNAFALKETSSLPEIEVSKLNTNYILKISPSVTFLSTAAPFFIWNGFSNRQAYFQTRIPVSPAEYSRAFNLNNHCPAGSSVTFITDSDFIDLKITIKKILNSQITSLYSSAGVDIYEKTAYGEHWLGCYAPINELQTTFKCKLMHFHENPHEITIYLPAFAQIQLLQVGVQSNSHLYQPTAPQKRIAIYGSSITQGCACSRPGLSYSNLLSRRLNCGIYNFGFSGSARGEIEIAQYIASLDQSAIVLEYDHNVDILTLENTHYNFYSVLRQNQPHIPIIMFSRTSGGLSISCEEEQIRYGIIQATFDRAKQNGDSNVFLLRGDTFFVDKEKYFVDDRHPNDHGMNVISQKLFEVLNTLI